jgi:hypothetical protein
MSVDYAPKGFHAYEVGGENGAKMGRTGMPVGIGLSLTFMETQILTKEYHRSGGFDKVGQTTFTRKEVESDTPPI